MGFAFNSKGTTTPPEVFKWKLFWVIVTAVGGSVIFGYDLAFIGGVFSLPSFIERFKLASENSSAIQAHMVNTFQGGAFFGVMMFYYFNERFGRRVALIAAGCVFNLGVVMQVACHGNIPVFYVGRFVSGLGIGGTTFVIPQYLSECAPAAARGGIVGCFEIGVQIGTIIGFWINYGVEKTWFIPITIQFIPATLMIVGLLFLCESPRWYYTRGRREQAQRSLIWLRQLPAEHPYVAGELSDYEEQVEHELLVTSSSGFRANSTGINAMYNFSVTFQVIGFQGSSAKLFSTGIYGIVKGAVATITFLFLVDRFGRRPLLFVGSVMCAFSMYYVAAYTSITNSFDTSQPQNAASNSAAAFIYIFGAGYVSHRLESPLDHRSRDLRTRVRSFCMVMTTCFHWLGEFYTAYAITYMFDNITYGTFLFFGSTTVLGAIYMYFLVPETNGVPLEDMDTLFEMRGLATQKMRAYGEVRAGRVIDGKDVGDTGSLA
ncbi:general substrate transporter [Aspergillus venezuelensis]